MSHQKYCNRKRKEKDFDMKVQNVTLFGIYLLISQCLHGYVGLKAKTEKQTEKQQLIMQ